jgi:hypothetical protein
MFNIIKKGQAGDTVMTFSFLFLLVVIFVGIFFGLSIFFGQEIDFRETEAGILNYKLRECVRSNGIEVINGIYSSCGIDERATNRGGMIFKICEVSCGEGNEGEYLFSTGGDFVLCRTEASEENRNIERCVVERISSDGNVYEIITGSNGKIRRLAA